MKIHEYRLTVKNITYLYPTKIIIFNFKCYVFQQNHVFSDTCNDRLSVVYNHKKIKGNILKLHIKKKSLHK